MVLVWTESKDKADYSLANTGIFGKIYDSSTQTTIINDFHINDVVPSNQIKPKVIAMNDGGFFVVWQGKDSHGKGIRGKRFSQSVVSPTYSEFNISTTEANQQMKPLIGVFSTGGFAVIWTGSNQDNNGVTVGGGDTGARGVFARIFDANASATTAEFQVNVTEENLQEALSVAVTNYDVLLVYYKSRYDISQESYFRIFIVQFDINGNRVGTEWGVNPRVYNKILNGGSMVILDNNQVFETIEYEMGSAINDNSKWGINGQIIQLYPPNFAPTDISISLKNSIPDN